ncbi:glycosyltransferase family 4 protein [Nordella sp. HKS 07]|uniref:glycosyltransferase family 4 protein n=1 Tax=Nordella sp. HKS 07 TaxID=2712222 RepID=UPI0013E1295B|nr:glycosyltransferase family 4 protein [Nordella sp. HKS 07]QIG47661.1 glycosyltransferase family 4 protein [Nordella sp. HKS 07]
MTKIVIVLKGYPRLSETFIAQELLGLERAGHELYLVSMRHPTDKKRHPVHDEIKAPVRYLPEYLHDEPWRVIRSWWKARRFAHYKRLRQTFLADLKRDFTRNRWRRFGQALVLAAEFPRDVDWLHAHFIHTPGSVTAYASLILDIGWSCSAHAKDIWTSPDWDLSAKLGQARWVVTCTKAGFDRLQSLSPDPSRVHLSYHGLDLSRFAHFDGARPARDGTDAKDPVLLLSVGRAVEKKGYDILIDALALLPKDLAWRFVHIGGGEKLSELKAKAEALGLAARMEWLGSRAQEDVLAQYRQSDLFVLPCRIARDGDRDGLPNVLVEASSQGLACISTTVSGVPELLSDGVDGLLVPPEDPRALSAALTRAIGDPQLRRRLGAAAETRVRGHFDHTNSIGELTQLFRAARGHA